jgi:hypothetical protein
MIEILSKRQSHVLAIYFVQKTFKRHRVSFLMMVKEKGKEDGKVI